MQQRVTLGITLIVYVICQRNCVANREIIEPFFVFFFGCPKSEGLLLPSVNLDLPIG